MFDDHGDQIVARAPDESIRHWSIGHRRGLRIVTSEADGRADNEGTQARTGTAEEAASREWSMAGRSQSIAGQHGGSFAASSTNRLAILSSFIALGPFLLVQLSSRAAS